MKRQTRYESEAQIIKAIDDCRGRALEKMKQAEKLELQALDFYQRSAISAQSNDSKCQNLAMGLKIEGNKANDEALKLRKQATRLSGVRLKKLGGVLAEFRTEPIAAVLGNDCSVVMP